jgi:hypothetical protein
VLQYCEETEQKVKILTTAKMVTDEILGGTIQAIAEKNE